MEAKLILMGNFIFCPLQQIPILGNDCQECEFISKSDEDYYCICKPAEDKQASLEEYDIKALINIFVDLLYSGQTSIKPEELIKILDL